MIKNILKKEFIANANTKRKLCINKKIAIIFGMILLVAGATYATGVVFFGGNSEGIVVTYTTNGTFTVPAGITSVEVLVVAGGGGSGGGGYSGYHSGGGGGGGVIYNLSYFVTPDSSVTVVVGVGGAAGTQVGDSGYRGGNGQSSSFGTLIAIGGGGGGANADDQTGKTGGSGGGGSLYDGAGGAGTTEQGNNGGTVIGQCGAGGGGAGSIGGNGTGTKYVSGYGGNGGNGVAYSINGTKVYYAGGGAATGQTANGNRSLGGTAASTDGAENTGAGGGGTYASAGKAGGSGIVIVRYGRSVMKASSSSSSGLVGYWALDGESYNSATNRTADKTPYSNHGTNYGATLTTDRMGHSNGAMDFHGVHDRIRANPIYLNQNNFSVFAWVYKKGAINSFAPLVEQGGLTQFRLIDRNNELCFGNDSAVNNFYCTSSEVIGENGKWYFIGAVVENRIVKIYVNAINLSYTQSAGTYGAVDDWYFYIGDRDYTSAVNAWNGSIEDVRVYNRSLSATEINALYNSYNVKAASGSLQTGLVLDMPLTARYITGETPGSELIKDKTPYSNNGQNYGAIIGNDSTRFGGDDEVAITSSESLKLTGNLTIDVWIKTSSGDNLAVVNKFGDGYSGYRFGSTTSGMAFGYGNSVGEYEGVSSAAISISDTWANIAVTKNGTNITFYLNGAFLSSSATSNPVLNTNEGTLDIGNNYWNGGWFTGNISNVKVYNRALSPSEIKLLYDKGR